MGHPSISSGLGELSGRLSSYMPIPQCKTSPYYSALCVICHTGENTRNEHMLCVRLAGTYEPLVLYWNAETKRVGTGLYCSINMLTPLTENGKRRLRSVF